MFPYWYLVLYLIVYPLRTFSCFLRTNILCLRTFMERSRTFHICLRTFWTPFIYWTSNQENKMVINHLNTHGRVDLAKWYGDSAMWIERTKLHQPICSLACDIGNHRIRIFLQYVFALPALGFYYYHYPKTFFSKRWMISDLILDGMLLQPLKSASLNSC